MPAKSPPVIFSNKLLDGIPVNGGHINTDKGLVGYMGVKRDTYANVCPLSMNQHFNL